MEGYRAWVEVQTFTERNGPEMNGYPEEGIPDGLYVHESEVEALRRRLEGAVDDPKLIETLARVIENRHGTLHGIGSTLGEALVEYKRGR